MDQRRGREPCHDPCGAGRGRNPFRHRRFLRHGPQRNADRPCACADRRDQVVLSVKFGAMRGPDGSWIGYDARPVAVKNFVAYSLNRLGVDHIDIYRPARLAPKVPIEETVGAIAELVNAGYVRAIAPSTFDRRGARAMEHEARPPARFSLLPSLQTRPELHHLKIAETWSRQWGVPHFYRGLKRTGACCVFPPARKSDA